MRVFVAGTTGAVGSRLLPLLVAAGHSVVGLTRSAAGADIIRGAGADPAIADATNRAGIVAAVANAKPDVVVHEMTSLANAAELSDRSLRPRTVCASRVWPIYWPQRGRPGRAVW
jgi:nucleoside-diphosphate-sugar epimerase